MIRTRVLYTRGMLTSDEIRDRLAWNIRAARVRAVYHRAMGEVIVFRLTFDDAPAFDIVEDVDTETVALATPAAAKPLVLDASEDHNRQQDYDAIRAWIEQHVNIGALHLAKRVTSAGHYWRTHPARRA